jgi:hypothetical protein
MRPVSWPEPDPQVAAAIGAMYGARRTARPLAVLIRDRLGQWLDDEAFAAAFGVRGKPGWSPSRLALVTVLQRAEKLTGRQVADAVRMRLDWKYLLGLPAGDPGFDHSVLPEFRARVAEAGLEQVVLDALLERLAADGLVKAGGKQRTDSTRVIAAVAALNRLELAGESVRAALEALAAAHPDWLAQRICVPDFARRYGTPMTSWRPPASEARRDELAIAYARDGYTLLEAVCGSSAPAWLREIPAIGVLRRVLVQNYTRVIGEDGREVIKRREKEPEGDGLPPGHIRIASPYDTDARWGVKREEFWLGCKLHVTETCDDPPPCSCCLERPASRPAAGGGDEPGRSRAGGREHDKGCAQVVFPNLITNVATTDATVTDNQMTGAIHDDLAARNLAPGRHYLDSGYLSAAVVVSALTTWGIALIGPLLAGHLRSGPGRARLRTRRLRRRLRRAHRHLPARKDVSVLDAVHPARQGRDRGHLPRQRLRSLPGSQPVHHQWQGPAAAHRAAPRPGRSPGRRPRRGEDHPVPGGLRPPGRRRGHHAPGRQPRRAAHPLPRPAENPPRPRVHGHRAQPAHAGGILERHAPGPAANQPPGTPRTPPRRMTRN